MSAFVARGSLLRASQCAACIWTSGSGSFCMMSSMRSVVRGSPSCRASRNTACCRSMAVSGVRVVRIFSRIGIAVSGSDSISAWSANIFSSASRSAADCTSCCRRTSTSISRSLIRSIWAAWRSISRCCRSRSASVRDSSRCTSRSISRCMRSASRARASAARASPCRARSPCTRIARACASACVAASGYCSSCRSTAASAAR